MTTALAVRRGSDADRQGSALDRLLGAWLLSYRSTSTRKAYAHDVRAFREWAEAQGRDVLDVTRVHVDAYVQALTDAGRRPTTVARALAALSSFYDYAQDSGMADASPVARVRRPKTGEDHVALTPALDLPGVRALLDAATTAQDRALVLALTATGLRISELLAFDLDGLTVDRGHTVAEVTGKGGRVDRVAVPPILAEQLGRIAQARGSAAGPVFVSEATGQRMTSAGAARALTRLGRRAGLIRKDSAGTWRGKVTPHMLRATAITLALNNGATLRDVQDFARHSDPRTTRRYDRDAGALDRSPAYGLAGLLAGTP